MQTLIELLPILVPMLIFLGICIYGALTNPWYLR